MRATSITVGLPVGDLPAAQRWYERVLDVPAPDLEPVDGVVEFEVGGRWLQLFVGQRAATDWVFRIGVSDVRAERDRLLGLGIDVGPVPEVAGVLAYCVFADPDQNQLSLCTLASSD